MLKFLKKVVHIWTIYIGIKVGLANQLVWAVQIMFPISAFLLLLASSCAKQIESIYAQGLQIHGKFLSQISYIALDKSYFSFLRCCGIVKAARKIVLALLIDPDDSKTLKKE